MSARTMREIRRMLDDIGINDPRLSMSRGGHLKIEFVDNSGETAIVYTSSTPSDHRTMDNLRAQVRRAARGKPQGS